MEKKKREKGSITSWIIIFVFIIQFIIFFNLITSLKGTTTFLLFNAFTLTIVLELLFSNEKIRTLEYEIYEFDFWNKSEGTSGEYIKAYWYSETELYAYYFMNFQYKNKILKETPKDIEKFFNNSFHKPSPFKTKEEVMKKILEEVREYLKAKGSSENVKIKGINVLETLTLEELEHEVNKLNSNK